MIERKKKRKLSRPANGIQVIQRAASILRSLRDQPDGLSLAQIAERVHLPRSTVQRIVSSLAAEGLLMAATPAGRVRLGVEIVALAATSRFDTVELLHPHIKALSEATGETVDLSVLHKDRLVFVDQVIGQQRLRAVSAVGEMFPIHSTANGKACLATLSDEEIVQLLPSKLPPLADGTIRSIDDLLAEVRDIRRTGIALDAGEHTQGISAIGGAVKDQLGLTYAMSMPVPTTRFERERAMLERQLRETLDRVRLLLREA